MKSRATFFFSLSLLFVFARSANADDEWSPPPARTGFQMAMRGYYAFPLGSAQSGLKQSDVLGGNVSPFFFDIGYKPRRHIFIGGYTGFAIGGCGDAVPAGVNGCGTISLRLGAEIIYSFLPAYYIDPWIGYGVGIEWNGVQGTNAGNLFGPELGNFIAGFDVRVSHGLGIGPYVNFGVGEYTSITSPITAEPETSFGKTFHEWLSIGGRFTILP